MMKYSFEGVTRAVEALESAAKITNVVCLLPILVTYVFS